MGSLSLFQWIFLTQESNWSLLHCRRILYQMSYEGNPGKSIALTWWTFVGRVMSLLFNTLSRFVISFLSRNMHLLISWLQSPSAVIFEPPTNSLSLFPLFPHLFAMNWWNQMLWSSFLNVKFSPAFSLSSRGSLVPLCFLP